jgi:hypothetical protein
MDPCPERTHPIIDIVVVVVTHPKALDPVVGKPNSNLMKNSTELWPTAAALCRRRRLVELQITILDELLI